MPQSEDIAAVPMPLQNDPAKPLGINFVGQSPHVFAYRFWTRKPDETTWTIVRDGNTVDQVPDFFAIGPLPDGTHIAYWVGISGKANSVFRFSIIFTQADRIPVGGTITHQGKTSSKGGSVVEGEVVLV